MDSDRPEERHPQTDGGLQALLKAEAEEMSISKAALIAVNNEGYDWSNIQGTKFWEYEGRTVHDLRMEAEAEG